MNCCEFNETLRMLIPLQLLRSKSRNDSCFRANRLLANKGRAYDEFETTKADGILTLQKISPGRNRDAASTSQHHPTLF